MNNEVKEILSFEEDADYKRLSIEDILLLKEYIERLNNILNELEKDLEDKYYGRGKYAMDSDVIGITDILDKIKELRGDSK